MDTAEDKTALGTFPYNTKVNAVIVEDDNAIRTAWIWEVEEGDNDIDDNNPIATEVTKIDADNFKIYLNAFVGADNRVAVITRAMEKAGYTDVTFASAANNEYTVTAQVKSSSGISTSLTFTTVTRWFSDSAIGAENVDNYNNAADLPDNSALIGDGSDLAIAGPVLISVDIGRARPGQQGLPIPAEEQDRPGGTPQRNRPVLRPVPGVPPQTQFRLAPIQSRQRLVQPLKISVEVGAEEAVLRLPLVQVIVLCIICHSDYLLWR